MEGNQTMEPKEQDEKDITPYDRPSVLLSKLLDLILIWNTILVINKQGFKMLTKTKSILQIPMETKVKTEKIPRLGIREKRRLSNAIVLLIAILISPILLQYLLKNPYFSCLDEAGNNVSILTNTSIYQKNQMKYPWTTHLALKVFILPPKGNFHHENSSFVSFQKYWVYTLRNGTNMDDKTDDVMNDQTDVKVNDKPAEEINIATPDKKVNCSLNAEQNEGCVPMQEIDASSNEIGTSTLENGACVSTEEYNEDLIKQFGNMTTGQEIGLFSDVLEEINKRTTDQKKVCLKVLLDANVKDPSKSENRLNNYCQAQDEDCPMDIHSQALYCQAQDEDRPMDIHGQTHNEDCSANDFDPDKEFKEKKYFLDKILSKFPSMKETSQTSHRFNIIRLLGYGNNGIVIEVEDLTLTRRALKIIYGDFQELKMQLEINNQCPDCVPRVFLATVMFDTEIFSSTVNGKFCIQGTSQQNDSDFRINLNFEEYSECIMRLRRLEIHVLEDTFSKFKDEIEDLRKKDNPSPTLHEKIGTIIIMELNEGKTLQSFSKRLKKESQEDQKRFLMSVLYKTLQRLEKFYGVELQTGTGIIHGDLNLSNVMISLHGIVTIIDLEHAKENPTMEEKLEEVGNFIKRIMEMWKPQDDKEKRKIEKDLLMQANQNDGIAAVLEYIQTEIFVADFSEDIMASCIMKVATDLLPREHTVTESPATNEDIPPADSKNGRKLRKHVKLESDSTGIFQEAEYGSAYSEQLDYSRKGVVSQSNFQLPPPPKDKKTDELREEQLRAPDPGTVRHSQKDAKDALAIRKHVKAEPDSPGSSQEAEFSYDDIHMNSLSPDFRQATGYSNEQEKDSDEVGQATGYSNEQEKDSDEVGQATGYSNEQEKDSDQEAADFIKEVLSWSMTDLQKANKTEDEMKP